MTPERARELIGQKVITDLDFEPEIIHVHGSFAWLLSSDGEPYTKCVQEISELPADDQPELESAQRYREGLESQVAAWKTLVNDIELKLGMKSFAVVPDARHVLDVLDDRLKPADQNATDLGRAVMAGWGVGEARTWWNQKGLLSYSDDRPTAIRDLLADYRKAVGVAPSLVKPEHHCSTCGRLFPAMCPVCDKATTQPSLADLARVKGERDAAVADNAALVVAIEGAMDDVVLVVQTKYEDMNIIQSYWMEPKNKDAK